MEGVQSRGPEPVRIGHLSSGYVLKGSQIVKPLLGSAGEAQDPVALALFAGDFSNLPPLGANEVRLFISSTFSDFKAERNHLTAHAYPALRQFCAERGLDFRVCDMRWGVTDASVNEHLVEKLCLREIEQCRRNSTGPFFVALIGDRYGYQPIPSMISSVDFDLLNHLAERYATRTAPVLNEWYVEDTNSDPPQRKLQPIRSKFPNYGDYSDEALRREAGNAWWGVEEAIRNTLRRAIQKGIEKKMWSPNRRFDFSRGVTEMEVNHALCLSSEPERSAANTAEGGGVEAEAEEAAAAVAAAKARAASMASRSLVYVRSLHGLKENLQKENAVKFADIVLRNDVETMIEESLELLQSVKSRVKAAGVRFKDFGIPWNDDGVTTSDPTHQRYLEQLSQTFVSDLRRMIQQRLAAEQIGASWRSPLTEEIAAHLHFAVDKTALFVGRENELAEVRQWALGGASGERPLVLYAESGGGKTALMARIVQLARTSWFPPKPCVTVLRFLGTTGRSCTIYQALRSVCEQVCAAFSIKFEPKKAETMKQLISYFPLLLSTASLKSGGSCQLLIALDSLDQLSPDDNAYACQWLPRKLPPGVLILLSTLPELHGVLPALQALLPAASFLPVAPLDADDVSGIVHEAQAAQQRRLTAEQEAKVLEALQERPNPLLVRLCLDRALAWTSYDPVENCELSSDTQTAIEQLFERLEIRYGSLLIRYALGYLTAGLIGLTELELEDVLTCQDVVLNEVYRYHDPPIKGVVRLPSLLWSRVRFDLQNYLCERQVDTKLVLTWYHRQFREVAESRYLSSEERRKELHSHLALYFSQERPLKRTVLLSNVKRTVEIKDADRQISYSTLSVRNPRQLRCVPYHLLHAGEVENFFRRCVIRFPFVETFVRVFGPQEYLSLLRQATAQFSRSEDHGVLPMLVSCFTFLQRFLQDDLRGLPMQLIGQFKLLRADNLLATKVFEDLCARCEDLICDRHHKQNHTCLLPIFNCFPSCFGALKWYQEKVEAVWMGDWEDAHLLVHCRDKENRHQIRLVNTEDMSRAVSLTVEKKPLHMRLSQDKNYIVYSDERHVHVHEADTGRHLDSHGLLINNKVLLKNCLALAHDMTWVAIAGQDRIALLLNKGPGQGGGMLSHRVLLTANKLQTLFLLFLPTASPRLLVSLHANERRYTVKCFRYVDKVELWSTELPANAAAAARLPSDPSRLFANPTSPLSILLATADANVFLLNAVDGSLTSHLRPPASSVTIGGASQASLCLRSLSAQAGTDWLSFSASHPDGRLLLRCVDLTARLRSEQTLAAVDSYTGERGAAAVAVPDGRGGDVPSAWVVGGALGSLCVPAARHWRGHQDRISQVALLNDAAGCSPPRVLSFAAGDRSLKLWDLATIAGVAEGPATPATTASSTLAPRLAPPPEFLNAQRPLLTSCFSPDKKRLYLVAEDGLTRWGVTDGRLLGSYKLANQKAFEWRCIERVVIFTINTGEDVAVLHDAANAKILVVDVSGEGKLVANHPAPQLWRRANDATGRHDVMLCVRQEPGHSYLSLQLKRLPSLTVIGGKRFLPPVEVGGAGGGQLLAIDWIVGKVEFAVISWRLGGRGKSKVAAWAINMEESGSTVAPIPCVATDNSKAAQRGPGPAKVGREAMQEAYSWLGPIDESGRVLVGGEGDLRVWDLFTGSCRLQHVPCFHTWFKHSVTINLSMKPGKKVQPIEGTSNQFVKWPITAIVASSQRDTIVSGCAGGHVMVWRWARTLALAGVEPSDAEVRELRFEVGTPAAHRDRVTCLALSADGSLLASGGADRTLCLAGLSEVGGGTVFQRIDLHMTPTELAFDFQQRLLVGKATVLVEERPIAFRVLPPGEQPP